MYHYPVHKRSQAVLRYIRKHDLLRPGDRAGVAVSGGADSVALLRILLELRGELGLVLSVVHLNHCLRGEEADGDENFVRELALRYDLPLFSLRLDVKAYADEKKLSIETAARELRYQYFESLLQQDEFNKLATAHTLDDQAETVLLKLARGAGTRGLAGIYPRLRLAMRPGDTGIVRPLLATQRSDLEGYLGEICQAWREDSTNSAFQHTRNRVRHEILPKLSADLNPRIKQTLAEAADIARVEEEFWDLKLQSQLPLVWSHDEQGGSLRRDQLCALPLAMQRRVVRAAAEALRISLDFSHVEEILLLENDGSETSLPSGWVARRAKGLIHFEQASETGDRNYEYQLPVPGKLELPELSLVVSASLVEQTGDDSPLLLDPRFRNLVVRNWRAGDRFWPSNTKEAKKIKELLQDRHITGKEKQRWPVISSGEQVVWMHGFGLHREVQASAGILITAESAYAPRI